MDRALEASLEETVALGLQNLRMLLMESVAAKSKSDGVINEKQYNTFRKVADKHWNKFGKRLNKHTEQIRRF